MRISETINVLQSKYNLTIPQLTALSGVTRKTLYEWKRRSVEKVPPKAARLAAIQTIFELYVLMGADIASIIELLDITVIFAGKPTTIKELVWLTPKSPILPVVAELAYCANRGTL